MISKRISRIIAIVALAVLLIDIFYGDLFKEFKNIILVATLIILLVSIFFERK